MPRAAVLLLCRTMARTVAAALDMFDAVNTIRAGAPRTRGWSNREGDALQRVAREGIP